MCYVYFPLSQSVDLSPKAGRSKKKYVFPILALNFCGLGIWEFSREELLIFRNVGVLLENLYLVEFLIFC